MEEFETTDYEIIGEPKEKKRVKKPAKVKPPKNSRNGFTALVAVLSLIIGALGMYLLVYYVIPIDNSNTVINKMEKEVTVNENGIADAVEKLYNAVVVVEIYANGNPVASGTGFVYKVDKNKAYILTNNHVVSNKGKVEVRVIFTNGSEEVVKVEGSDAYSDLAVLSLDADKILQVADIGSNESMRVGDTVFTIGAPLDTEYYWTVTRGILSGKDRMIEVDSTNTNSIFNPTNDYVMKVLQTDASINSGNSGGPIANSNGEVIGITNMKLVSSGVEGIGFAIPIEDAVEFADIIISGEQLKRPQLGVSMANMSTDSDRLNLYKAGITLNTELKDGVVVVEIQNNTPAAKAGLKRGDIVIKMDDDEIKNAATLRYYLYKRSVGDTTTLTIERNGKIETIKVKLTAASKN